MSKSVNMIGLNSFGRFSKSLEFFNLPKRSSREDRNFTLSLHSTRDEKTSLHNFANGEQYVLRVLSRAFNTLRTFSLCSCSKTEFKFAALRFQKALEERQVLVQYRGGPRPWECAQCPNTSGVPDSGGPDSASPHGTHHAILPCRTTEFAG